MKCEIYFKFAILLAIVDRENQGYLILNILNLKNQIKFNRKYNNKINSPNAFSSFRPITDL